MKVIKGDYRRQNSRHANELTEPSKATFYKKIIEALTNSEGLPFGEIANKANLHSQQVSKRLSELEKQGKIEVIGKTKSKETGMPVSVWAIKKD